MRKKAVVVKIGKYYCVLIQDVGTQEFGAETWTYNNESEAVKQTHYLNQSDAITGKEPIFVTPQQEAICKKYQENKELYQPDINRLMCAYINEFIYAVGYSFIKKESDETCADKFCGLVESRVTVNNKTVKGGKNEHR